MFQQAMETAAQIKFKILKLKVKFEDKSQLKC